MRAIVISTICIMPKKIFVEEDDAEMNWYKWKGIQKLVEKEEPYPLENIDIKVNSRIPVCGPQAVERRIIWLVVLQNAQNNLLKLLSFTRRAKRSINSLVNNLRARLNFTLC